MEQRVRQMNWMGKKSLFILWMIMGMTCAMTTSSVAEPLDDLFRNLSLGYDGTGNNALALSSGERDLEDKAPSVAGTYFIKEMDIDLMGFRFNYSAESDYGVFSPYFRLEWVRDENSASRTNGAVNLIEVKPDTPQSPTSPAPIHLSEDQFNFGVGVLSVLPYGVMAFFDYETALTPEEEKRTHLFSVGLRLAY